MMTPNLLVAGKAACQPHKWFKSNASKSHTADTEHRDQPVSGTYQHFKGRGWYLVSADDSNDETFEQQEPLKVVYSKVLHRWMFETEYKGRTRLGFLPASSRTHSTTSLSSDKSKKNLEVGFFRMDDDLTWINNTDHEGYFVPGPYQRFVIDKETSTETFFREMTYADSRYGTPAESRTPSCTASRTPSRNPSQARSRHTRPEDKDRKLEGGDLAKALDELSLKARGRSINREQRTSLVVPNS